MFSPTSNRYSKPIIKSKIVPFYLRFSEKIKWIEGASHVRTLVYSNSWQTSATAMHEMFLVMEWAVFFSQVTKNHTAQPFLKIPPALQNRRSETDLYGKHD